MKRFFITIVCCALFFPVKAQISMRDVWLSMPDSILPYLNKNQRLEHLDFLDMHVTSEVKNLLGGEGRMDTLTADYTMVHLTAASTLQMKLLTQSDSTQLICFVKTFHAPEPESSVLFYDQNWKLVSASYGLPLSLSSEEVLKHFTFQPEGMDSERYEELCKMIEPVMLSARLSPESSDIVFQLSTPTFTQKEKEEVKAIVKQIKFKWNGETFKEL